VRCVIIVFGLVLFLSLLLIPVGLPGTWVMILAGVAYLFLAPVSPFGWLVVIGCVAIAVVAEILEFLFAAGYTKKYGGSNRAAWGAIIGGLVGAVIGVPVPIIGSVIGGFVGAFAGAMIGEFSRGTSAEGATRAATGATIGRAVAIALKTVAGVMIAAWFLAAAVF
jgi:uncharacterized protein YqgC (DUF456 family)